MNNIRNNNGITMLTLITTILVMGILVSATVMTIGSITNISKLNQMNADIEFLQAEVDLYYQQSNSLPIKDQISGDFRTIVNDPTITANDNQVYYEIDLAMLDYNTLNYGTKASEGDYYIVNEQSHKVYYYAGVEVDDVKYYTAVGNSSVVEGSISDIENFEFEAEKLYLEGKYQIKITSLSSPDVKAYKYKIDGEDWLTTNSETHTFNDLSPNSTHKIYASVIDQNDNEIYATNNGALIELTMVSENIPLGTVVTIDTTFDGQATGSYSNPLIPKGFAPINQGSATWESATGYQQGLVIQDSSGNQFVWVPVDGSTVTLSRIDWGISNGTYSSFSESMPTEITSSITTNGGFYIARYEAGGSSGAITSKQGQTVYNNINWTNSLAEADGMYNSSSYGVTSALIYGAQWDAALKFIQSYTGGDSGYPTDSTDKGNYTGSLQTTGYSSSYMKKNIYDMGGNVWELTQEVYSSSRTLRGGSYGNSASSYPAGYRHYYTVSSSTASVGFRVALYL